MRAVHTPRPSTGREVSEGPWGTNIGVACLCSIVQTTTGTTSGPLPCTLSTPGIPTPGPQSAVPLCLVPGWFTSLSHNCTPSLVQGLEPGVSGFQRLGLGTSPVDRAAVPVSTTTDISSSSVCVVAKNLCALHGQWW